MDPVQINVLPWRSRTDLQARLSAIPVSRYIAFLISLIGLLLLFSGDFGESWDVRAQEGIGQKAYIYYFKGFDGTLFRNVDLLGRGPSNKDAYFGPLIDLLIGFAQQGATDLLQRHQIRVFVQAFLSLSCLIPIFLICTRVISKPLALISVCLVAATPVFFGHAFINPKDSIFASGFLWTLFFILVCFGDGRRPGYGAFVGIGVLLGVITSLRCLAAYLLTLIFLSTTLVPALRQRGANKSLQNSRLTSHAWQQLSLNYRGLAVLLFSFAAAYTVCMPFILSDFGPQAYVDVLRKFARHTDRMTVLYFGDKVPNDALPWHYIYGYMLVQLPLYYHFFLLTILASIIALPRITLMRLKSFFLKNDQASWTVVLILLALIVPLCLILIVRPVLNDGFRHLLFIVPLISMLLYFGFLGVLPQVTNFSKGVIVMIATLCWIEAVLALKWLHPYEYAYYNPLVNPVGSFELDYWATSFREVADRLNQYARENTSGGEKLRLAICGPRWPLADFLDAEKFEVVRPEDRNSLSAAPQLTVALNRFNCLDDLKEPWLISVTRGTWVFAVVTLRQRP
jgi:hypothetical protein